MQTLASPHGVRFGASATRAGGTALLALTGELDLAARPRVDALLHGLIDGGARELIVDLSALEFLDGSGVRTLVDVANVAETAGARLYLVGAAGQPADVLAFALDRAAA